VTEPPAGPATYKELIVQGAWLIAAGTGISKDRTETRTKLPEPIQPKRERFDFLGRVIADQTASAGHLEIIEMKLAPAHNPEVTGSNPVPATERLMARSVLGWGHQSLISLHDLGGAV
jgi:hypothetical protein